MSFGFDLTLDGGGDILILLVIDILLVLAITILIDVDIALGLDWPSVTSTSLQNLSSVSSLITRLDVRAIHLNPI